MTIKPGPGTKLRVAIVVDDLAIAGPQDLIKAWVNRLDPERFEWEIFTVCGGGPVADELRRAGHKVSTLRLVVMHRVWFWFTFPWTAFAGFPRLWLKLARGRFDVVHTHMFLSNTFGRIAAVLAGVPGVLAHEHNMYHWKTGLHIWVDRVLARRSRWVVVTSEGVKRFTMAQEGIAEGKFRVLPNSVETEVFAPGGDRGRRLSAMGLAPGCSVVGTFGRMVRQKGLPDLLRAFALVAPEFPDCYCVLIGNGKEEGRLAELANQLGIESRVRMLPTRREIHEDLCVFDVFVEASHWTGVSLTLLQSMAAGVAVIATDLPPHEGFVVDGQTGLIYPPGDVGRLGELLRACLADVDYRRRLGERGRLWVSEKFSMSQMVRGLELLYEDAVRC